MIKAECKYNSETDANDVIFSFEAEDIPNNFNNDMAASLKMQQFENVIVAILKATAKSILKDSAPIKVKRDLIFGICKGAMIKALKEIN